MIPAPCLTFSFAGISIPWLCTQVDMSAAEAATVARFEGAADAEESLRWRLADALAFEDAHDYQSLIAAGDPKFWLYQEQADAAIRVMRGDDA